MDNEKYPDIICKALARKFMYRVDADECMMKFKLYQKQNKEATIEEILIQGYLNVHQIRVLNSSKKKHIGINELDITMIGTEKTSPRTFSARTKITVGSKLGPYVILRTLGKGGMGVVYLANQESPNREVALKVINKAVKPESFQGKRFLREVEISAQLDHQYIIKVYDGGIENTISYLAMSYEKGVSLQKYMEEHGETLSLAEKLEIIDKIAKGLTYSHSKGIIHRDIKPSNIMITEEKDPKIMDFGLAKNNRVSKKLTQTGEILGTPSYMSPEQAKGYKVDERTDIYSLGNIAYEFITGRMMYPGDNTMDIINRVAYHTPPLPRWVDSTIPEEVEAIILKSIHKNPNKRYQKIYEMSEDIENYLLGKRTQAGKHHMALKNRWRYDLYKKRLVLGCMLLLFVISGIFFLFSKDNKEGKTDWHNLTNLEELAQKSKVSPSLKVYLRYIYTLQSLKRYEKALEICEKAIVWCRNAKRIPHKFLLQKIDLLFIMQRYDQIIETQKKLPQKIQYRTYKNYIIALFRLKNYRKLFHETQKYPDLIKKQKLHFYAGAGRVLLFYQNRDVNSFLEFLYQGKFQNHPHIKEAIAFLKKNERKRKNIVPYLLYCYAIIKDSKNVLPYDREIQKHFNQQEKLLFYEAKAINAFCQKDYEHAIKYLLQCNKYTSFKNTYYKFLAQVEEKKTYADIDKLIYYAVQSLNISPYELSPLKSLYNVVLKNNAFERYEDINAVLHHYFSKINTNIKPNILEDNFHALAKKYLQLPTFSFGQKFSKKLNYERFIKRTVLKKQSVYVFKVAKRMLSDMRYDEKLIAILKKMKKECKNKDKEKIKSVLQYIKEQKRDDQIHILKKDLALFFLEKDNDIFQKIRANTSNSIFLLKYILYNKKETILFRFWCAKMLADLEVLDAYKVLQNARYTKNIVISSLSFIALKNKGFQIQIPSQQFTSAKLSLLSQQALILILDHLGEHFPVKTCQYFVKHENEKIRFAAVKSLLMNEQYHYIKMLAEGFKSKNPKVKMYAYWWFWTIANRKNNPDLFFEKRYLKQLSQAFFDNSSDVRLVAIAILGTLAKGEKVKNALEGAVKKLFQTLSEEKENAIKIQILITLVKWGHYKSLIQILSDPQFDFAMRMIILVGFSRDAKFRIPLIESICKKHFFKGQDSKFTSSVLLTLTKLNFSLIIDLLIKYVMIEPLMESMKHKNRNIRLAASYAIAKILTIPKLERHHLNLDIQSHLVKAFRILKKQYSIEKDQEVQKILKVSILFIERYMEYKHLYSHKILSEKYRKILAYRHYQTFETVWDYSFKNLRIGTQEGKDKTNMRKLVTLIFEGIDRSVMPWHPRINIQGDNAVMMLKKKAVEILIKRKSRRRISKKEETVYKRFFIVSFLFHKLRSIDTAIKIDKTNARYHFEKAFILEKIGLYKSALESYKKATQLDPKSILYKTIMAQFLVKTNQSTALKILDFVLEYKGKGYQVALTKALIYEHRRNFKLAEKYFKQSYLEEPSSLYIMLKKCGILITNNKLVEARKELEKILKCINEEERLLLLENDHKIMGEIKSIFLFNQSQLIYKVPRGTERSIFIGGFGRSLRHKKKRILQTIISGRVLHFKGFYLFLKSRFYLKKKNRKKGIESYMKGNYIFNTFVLNNSINPFTKENIRKYQEFSLIEREILYKNIPEKILGFTEQ